MHSLDNFNQLTRRVLVLSAVGFSCFAPRVLWPIWPSVLGGDLKKSEKKVSEMGCYLPNVTDSLLFYLHCNWYFLFFYF